MKDNSPCFGCDKRTATCHAKCEEYAKWQKAHITKHTLLVMKKNKQTLSYIPKTVKNKLYNNPYEGRYL